MRFPAAVFYAIPAGLVALSIYAPHIAAVALAGLSGMAMSLMLVAGFHPLYGEIFIGTVRIPNEPESGD